MRTFDTGATRDNDQGKLDFEGFFSPLVLEEYAEYMNKHRKQSDGQLRDSDNWQKGIPLTVYMKSLWRHFFDLWKEHRGIPTQEGRIEALMGCLFNVMGYAHQYLIEKEREGFNREEYIEDIMSIPGSTVGNLEERSEDDGL